MDILCYSTQISPGVMSGLCDGDTIIHEHVLNYTRDFFNSDYPAKWAAMTLNAKHRFVIHIIMHKLKRSFELVLKYYNDV